MKFKLFYIAKPYIVSQVWGVYRPEIYSQFGFTKHNGEDIALGKDFGVYCPVDGVVYRKLWQPNGGGVVLSILTDTFEWEDGKKSKVLIDFLHLATTLKAEGQAVKVGDKLALGDNTGFSTGPHTHIQARRVVEINHSLIDVDKNDANNTFDHSKYYNGLYAQDYTTEVINIYPTQEQKNSIIKALDWLKLLLTKLK